MQYATGCLKHKLKLTHMSKSATVRSRPIELWI